VAILRTFQGFANNLQTLGKFSEFLILSFTTRQSLSIAEYYILNAPPALLAGQCLEDEQDATVKAMAIIINKANTNFFIFIRYIINLFSISLKILSNPLSVPLFL